MKKVRFVLTSIAVLVAVGGALAFKAKNTYGGTIYTSTQAFGCTVATPDYTLGGNAAITYATNVSGGGCSLRFITPQTH